MAEEKKTPYETPVIIPLGELARGLGATCGIGSFPGSFEQPSSKCNPGTTAGGQCGNGSTAAQTCNSGSNVPSGTCVNGSGGHPGCAAGGTPA